MVGLTTIIPRIDEQSIRDALEKIRQARPLGASPLKRLLWLHLGSHIPLGDEIGLEVIIMDRLLELITDHLHEARQAVNSSYNTLEPKNAIEQDFSQKNLPLEAWSALYYRYVVIELDWSVNQIASLTTTNPRYIHRRMAVGLRRMAETINRYELQTRQDHWGAWLRSKLPPSPYAQLYGFGVLQDELRQTILTLADVSFIQVVGLAGSGKTALTHAVIRQLINQDLIGDFAWVTISTVINYQTLLAEIAQALGYHHLTHLAHDELETALRVIFTRRFTLLVVDNAERLQNAFDNLNRLDSLIGSGRLIIVSRVKRDMLVPAVYIEVHTLDEEAFIRIMSEHIRLKRMVLGDVDKEDLCRRLFHITGGNPLTGKVLLNQAAYLDEADFEQLLTHIPLGDDKLLPTLFGHVWKTFSQLAQHIVTALFSLGGEASLGELADLLNMKQEALSAPLTQLIDHFWVRRETQEPSVLQLEPLASRYIDEHVDAHTFNTHLTKLTTPHPALLHKILSAPSAEHNVETIQELAALVKRFDLWGEWRIFLITLREQTPEDPLMMAILTAELGRAEGWFGEVNRAIELLETSVASFQQCQAPLQEAEAQLSLGRLYFQQTEIESAQVAFGRAAALGQQTDEELLVQRSIKGAINIALHRRDSALLDHLLGQLDEALLGADYYAVHGSIALAESKPQRAISHYKAALDLYGAELDMHALAMLRFRLAVAYFDSGHREECVAELTIVLSEVRALGDVFTEARTLANLGTAYAELNNTQAALQAWRRATELQEALNDATARAYTIYNLANLVWQANASESDELFQMAWRLAYDYKIEALLRQLHEHPGAGHFHE